MKSWITSTWERPCLVAQLLGTVAILAWVPGNAAKLVAMLLVWTLGFGKISRAELVLMFGVNLLFAFMNAGALHKGVFYFKDPDIWGMPVYEFFMWGFYTLHVLRFLNGNPPEGKLWIAIALAIAFSVPFSAINDPAMLTTASAVILAVAMFFYHDPPDIAYVAYTIVLGALIEYAGVWSGQWGYPGNPPGGVPLWFITMWGGVGLFTRRLLLRSLRGAQVVPVAG